MTAPLLDAISTWYLCGLTITVLVVVYPAFALVGDAQWQHYHDAHARRITFAVAPAWAIEAFATVWWLRDDPTSPLAIGAASFALVTVLTTVGGAVPAHNVLATDRSRSALRRLQRAHLVRSLAWCGAATLSTLAVIHQLP